MRKFILALVLALGLVGCGTAPLNLLTGGGPNVAANVQAGAENNQTVGVSKIEKQTITRPSARTIEQSSGVTSVRSERVEQVVVNEMDWRYVAIIALLTGFLVPSPSEIANWVRNWFARRRTGN